jgi:uncharacterized protein YaiI (UPF0178 family)
VNIWVDADACPKPVKEILYRVANRLGDSGLRVTLIANQMLTVPRSPYIRAVQVAQGFDVADNEIVRRVEAGDLVITADIPLAADAIAQGARVLTPRGEAYDKNSITAALTLRNFMDTLRASGVDTGGPAAFSTSDQHAFARQLDQLLAGRNK